ncbi:MULTISPECIES: hypothetical protein [unclassified Spirosoma]|uniref:hypothetical protein n=1 Tax=unclassified Spirosoma TaxID=2621999 RepID=UPI001AD2F19F|nr:MULTISPECIES: hypothetical protein [unclassified Spirosoma]MBN8826953.1 hypothetical protein [Spirosoma sp.]
MQKQPQQQIVLYTCANDEFGHDPFVSEHWLVLIVSGSTDLFSQQGTVSHPAGTLGLIRKNQLVKAMKRVGDSHTFASISICLDQKRYRNSAQTMVLQQAVRMWVNRM